MGVTACSSGEGDDPSCHLFAQDDSVAPSVTAECDAYGECATRMLGAISAAAELDAKILEACETIALLGEHVDDWSALAAEEQADAACNAAGDVASSWSADCEVQIENACGTVEITCVDPGIGADATSTLEGALGRLARADCEAQLLFADPNTEDCSEVDLSLEPQTACEKACFDDYGSLVQERSIAHADLATLLDTIAPLSLL